MTGVLYLAAFVVPWSFVCLFVVGLFVFLRCGTNLLFRLFVCFLICSTSPPGGNQVDGLPPAASFDENLLF